MFLNSWKSSKTFAGLNPCLPSSRFASSVFIKFEEEKAALTGGSQEKDERFLSKTNEDDVRSKKEFEQVSLL